MKDFTPEQIAALEYRYDFARYNDDGTRTPVHPLAYRDADGDTALHIAAIAKDIEAVSWLLDAGIDPNSVGDMGQTAVHWAASNKDRGMAELLIAFGAETDIVDAFGRRADMAALRTSS
ncbi:ankyrin repeat domain-containing protein [Sphingomonas endolithica]|uniref:ankyrin repeat domain-containing protein n=1 Tax=Sphingomonas endolithica TaxID=2972485 RepID=UPI0021AFA52F|nr:ankyrin repeat domain-containing protein [Sphingomonas sp. ZFBP2030]